ncbi:MAG: hypothetical protein WKF58_11695 [Ilumatobacteraceae bacterium]
MTRIDHLGKHLVDVDDVSNPRRRCRATGSARRGSGTVLGSMSVVPLDAQLICVFGEDYLGGAQPGASGVA